MIVKRNREARTERTFEFIEKARELHKNYYSYEKTKVKSRTERVTITCPIHGDYTQTPAKHLIGRGCSKCGKEKASSKTRKTAKQFISDAKKIHKSRYMYRQVDYKNGTTPVIIECKVHGPFSQKPTNHLNGHGCPQCSKEKVLNSHRRTTQQFIDEANKVHNNFYSYKKTVYLTGTKPVEITCPKHGDFMQIAVSHLRGSGCQKCANIRRGHKRNESKSPKST